MKHFSLSVWRGPLEDRFRRCSLAFTAQIAQEALSSQQHFVVEELLLNSHMKFYRDFSEAIAARDEHYKSELAEMERQCIELEAAINNATEFR